MKFFRGQATSIFGNTSYFFAKFCVTDFLKIILSFFTKTLGLYKASLLFWANLSS